MDISKVVSKITKEHKELNDKIVKLEEFLESDRVSVVSEDNLCLLQLQLSYMNGYSKTLMSRISNLKESTSAK